MIQDNAAKGVERLHQLLEMDANFHHLDEDGKFVAGELTGKEQLALSAIAMDRGFGRSENVSITHTHGGTVGLSVNNKLKQISEKLPERIAQQRTIDAKVEEAKLLD